MSKKRGLNIEEKRTRMLEIFFETKDVFQLKDIEKIAPKEKGITAMSVKEVLQSLVDDGMVDTDRIGSSNYFWAFPSKALHARKRKLEEFKNQFSEYSRKKEILQESIEKSKIGRQDTAERAALIQELAALRQKKDQLKAEIDKYKECDPDVVEDIRSNMSRMELRTDNKWLVWVTDRGRSAEAETLQTEEVTRMKAEITKTQRQWGNLAQNERSEEDCKSIVEDFESQANKVAKEAANRWTDNIFVVKSWAKRKFGFEDSKINKTFGIPEDFDYID